MDYSESAFAKSLSGSPVCELRQADVRKNNLFMLTRKSGNRSQSMSFSYQTLLRQLSSDLLGSLSVGSMAFQDKWRYAKVDHNHDGRYNAFGISYAEPESEDKVQIASISVGSGFSQVVYGVWAPQVEFKAEVTPEIGTLRFVYSSAEMEQIENSDLSAEGWDGWAYPDGSTYEVDPVVFAKALAVYGKDATHITLPAFSDFFSAEPRAVDDVENELSQIVPVANHVHSIGKLNFEGQLKIKSGSMLSTYYNKNKSDGTEYLANGKVHRGTNTWAGTGDVQFKLDLDSVQFKDLSCGDCIGCESQEQGQFRPRNVKLPVMIYIGGVK